MKISLELQLKDVLAKLSSSILGNLSSRNLSLTSCIPGLGRHGRLQAGCIFETSISSVIFYLISLTSIVGTF